MKTTPITPEQLAQLFPGASKSLIAANQGIICAPAVEAPIPEVKPRRATEPNKTEREYERILRAQYPDAEIRWEAYTLRLADRCSYSPDFSVLHRDNTIDFHEVKGGYVFPKALVKLRVAAQEFPHRFFLAQKTKGEWKITELSKRA